MLPSLQDFYDLTMAYFRRARADNVVHAEIFFDPQTHTARGIPLRQVIQGIARAQQEAEQSLGVSSGLILCFLRDQGPQKAMQTLTEVGASAKEIPSALPVTGHHGSEERPGSSPGCGSSMPHSCCLACTVFMGLS